MRHIDTLIHAGWVIPVEPEGVVLEQHAVAVHEGQILDILPSEQAVGSYSARITHQLRGHVVIPGFVNAHTHAAMSLLRGYADDLPLMEWLNKRIWPAEKAWVGPSFVEDGTRLAIAEMLLSGTTCFNDMYFFPDITGKVAEEVGIRACIGLILIDFPTVWAQDAAEYLAKAEKVREQFQYNAMIQCAMAPHAPYSVSDQPLEQAGKFAADHGLRVHIHVHETADEINHGMKTDGFRPMARLDTLGLTSDRLLAVHTTQLEDAEIQHLADKKAHVIHCPESNLKLASGFCPVDRLMKAGVNVALGTDSAASNDDLDMLGEMRTAALLAKGVSKDASALPAAVALRMATLNGAKALGMEDITGSLRPGKSADLVAVDLSGLESQPIYDPLAQLVYATNRHQISDVWVAGQHVVKSRVLKTINSHELHAKVHGWRRKILSTHQGEAPEATVEEA